MESQNQLEAKLAKIEARIQSGIKSVTTDGTSTNVDLAALKEEATRLRRRLNSRKARRPVASRIDLGSF